MVAVTAEKCSSCVCFRAFHLLCKPKVVECELRGSIKTLHTPLKWRRKNFNQIAYKCSHSSLQSSQSGVTNPPLEKRACHSHGGNATHPLYWVRENVARIAAISKSYCQMDGLGAREKKPQRRMFRQNW